MYVVVEKNVMYLEAGCHVASIMGPYSKEEAARKAAELNARDLMGTEFAVHELTLLHGSDSWKG